MGLLSIGTPLCWNEVKDWNEHIRKHGVEQFINLYHKLKDQKNECLRLLWGDEIEYTLVHLDKENKIARVNLRALELLPPLQEKEEKNDIDCKSLWRPEYAEYMIEGTPGAPYGSLISHFNIVEANMKARREEVNSLLKPNEICISMTCFPRLGCPDFTYPKTVPDPRHSKLGSLFIPDEVPFSGHPRFMSLSVNVKDRRGKKVVINEPIFKDINTKNPFVEDYAAMGDNGEAATGAKKDHVYMDAMAFGMGMSSLQVTFQACNINEARSLYDQLNPLCAILLALSAASPIRRGYLVDTDCRWNTVSSSVDCRTDEELGIKTLKENKFVIKKSRYSPIDSYLSPMGACYNDVPLVKDEAIYKRLIEAGIDHLLAQHIAHLFIRDSLSAFKEKLHLNDEEDSDHFENIQSTNWQTMRFKPPPPNTKIGWRVEFRPTEVQLTDFENAAYVVFVALMTRVILSFKLNLLIPISKTEENLEEAHKRDSVLNGKFWFRKDIYTSNTPENCRSPSDCNEDLSSQYSMMTVNEIINGKEGEFPGMVPLCLHFLSTVDVDVDTMCTIQQYLRLIRRRASGELKTLARWTREFISNHPDYKKDSVVSDSINYDFLVKCDAIQKGVDDCSDLFDKPSSKTKENIPDAVNKASLLKD